MWTNTFQQSIVLYRKTNGYLSQLTRTTANFRPIVLHGVLALENGSFKSFKKTFIFHFRATMSMSSKATSYDHLVNRLMRRRTNVYFKVDGAKHFLQCTKLTNEEIELYNKTHLIQADSEDAVFSELMNKAISKTDISSADFDLHWNMLTLVSSEGLRLYTLDVH